MTPAQALALWPKLMRTGMRLGSPAVAADGDKPGGWLDEFMKGAAARHYRVDFIALHWYGTDFDTSDAVARLRRYVRAVYARYHKPIWLTEFALIRFGTPKVYPSGREQAAFLKAATAMLAGLRGVERYAWFALLLPPRTAARACSPRRVRRRPSAGPSRACRAPPLTTACRRAHAVPPDALA